MRRFFIVVFILLGIPHTAHAAFALTSSIVEFSKESGKQQDIEISSVSKDSDYITSEIYEVRHAGLADESRSPMLTPEEAGLLVAPDKFILSAGGKKTLRFVLLRDQDAEEHIYRVVIKPVVRSVDSEKNVGIKILVGYEILVIVRPASVKAVFTLQRQGNKLIVENTGNTNLLLQSGQQCSAPASCQNLPMVRVYANETHAIDLPSDAPLTYYVWDGSALAEKLVN
jgi:P pilus assembly chaperone PapD